MSFGFTFKRHQGCGKPRIVSSFLPWWLSCFFQGAGTRRCWAMIPCYMDILECSVLAMHLCYIFLDHNIESRFACVFCATFLMLRPSQPHHLQDVPHTQSTHSLHKKSRTWEDFNLAAILQATCSRRRQRVTDPLCACNIFDRFMSELLDALNDAGVDDMDTRQHCIKGRQTSKSPSSTMHYLLQYRRNTANLDRQVRAQSSHQFQKVDPKKSMSVCKERVSWQNSAKKLLLHLAVIQVNATQSHTRAFLVEALGNAEALSWSGGKSKKGKSNMIQYD